MKCAIILVGFKRFDAGTIFILFQASIISRLPYAMCNPPLVPRLNALFKLS
jgi:hypothetical protein